MFTESWVAAAKTKRIDRLMEFFAPDAVFISPVSHKPMTGPAAIRAILTAVMQVLPDLSYGRCEMTATGAVLVFSGTVDGLTLEGMDLFTLNGEGKVSELKVFVRPLKATMAFAEKMQAALAQ